MEKTESPFKCVPIDNAWTIQGTKYDLKAIYRRARKEVDQFDRVVQARGEDGLPLWDLTTPLPMRRHSDWLAKGYEYVTLADRESLEKAAQSLREKGLNPASYVQHPQLGPWNPKLYLATAAQADRLALNELRKMVEQFGSEAVEKIRRSSDPAYTLPPELQGISAGGRVEPSGGSADQPLPLKLDPMRLPA